MWKCAVEYHTFFRLRSSLKPASETAPALMINGFIRRGSRFRGPDRTEFQTHNLSRTITPRRSVQFERRPSQRFSRRASYAIKRKLQEQHKVRSSQQQPQQPSAKNNSTSNTNLINFSLHEVNAEAKPSIPPRLSPTASNSSNQNALVPSLSDSKLCTAEVAIQVAAKTDPAQPSTTDSLVLNTSSTLSEISTINESCSKSNDCQDVKLCEVHPPQPPLLPNPIISKTTRQDLKEAFSLDTSALTTVASSTIATVPNVTLKSEDDQKAKQNGFTRKPTLTKVSATATTFTNGKITSTAGVLNRNTSLSLNSNPLSSSSSSSSSTSSTSSSHFNSNLHLRISKQPITTEL